MKPTPLKRRRRIRAKSDRAEIIARCDGLVKQLVVRRDGPNCRRCGRAPGPGRVGAIHAAHIRSKGAHPALRFRPENVMLLCYRCHAHFWHGADPGPVWEWARAALGIELLCRLDVMAGARPGRLDLALEESWLRAELEKGAEP